MQLGSGNQKLLARLLTLSQVGFVIAGGPVIGLLLDTWLGTSPWLLVVGAVLGFVSGMIQLVALSRPMPGEDKPDRGPPP
jgi:F0F1-type ATP synthase assembly protein I